MPQIPYSQNILLNGSAENGDTSEWSDVVDVSVVDGGIDGDKSFKFEPTASMKQNRVIPGQPPDLLFEAFFLPGRDIRSAAQVKAEIIFTLHYGDGSSERYIIPGKTFIGGAGI